MKRGLFHGYVILVSQIASAIIGGVAVDAFTVTVSTWHPDPVPVSGHRGEVEHTDQMILFCKTDIGDHTGLRIVAINP
jgi:hypothetical protein